MATRIIIPENDKAAGVIEAQKQTVTNDKFPVLFYHAKMAVALGLFIWFCCSFILLGIAFYIPGVRPYIPHMLMFGLMAGSFAAGWTGIAWIKEAATRAWKIENIQLNRQFDLEDRLMNEPADDPDRNLPPSSDGYKLKAIGMEILYQHYEDGKDCTRKECEKDGVNQADWNKVNNIMKALNIKGERGWMEKITMNEAMRRWLTETYFEPDGKVRVKVDENEWKAVT